MMIFDVWSKKEDELTDKEKKFLETGVQVVIGGLTLGAGLLIGDTIGCKRTAKTYQKNVMKFSGDIYKKGVLDGRHATLKYIHEENPREFLEIMKVAQDKNVIGMYKDCMTILPGREV